jgi:hypothetical protein
VKEVWPTQACDFDAEAFIKPIRLAAETGHADGKGSRRQKNQRNPMD